MVARLCVLGTALIALQAAPAFGREKDPREIQAQEDCLSGKTESGVALLAKLYALTGQVNYIYNQARCYEQAARPEDAINRFREYLRVAKTITPDEKADVEKHLQECRALQAEQERARGNRAAAAPAPAATIAPAVPAASAAPVPLSAAPAPVAETGNATPEATNSALDLSSKPDTKKATPIYARWWFWTGLAAVVGGAVTAYFLVTRRTTENACSGSNIACDAI